MSQNGMERKGFFLHHSQCESLFSLPDAQLAAVIRACHAFSCGKEPDLSDPIVACAFGLMRPSLEMSIKRAEAGRKGGEANGSKPEANESKRKQIEAKQEIKNKKQELIRKDSSLRSESSPEQSAVADTSGVVAVATPAEIILPLTGNREFAVSREDVREWSELYPAVDVMQELRAMRGWLMANPRQQKTPAGIKRFCNSWLAKKQDRSCGGSPRASPGNQPAAPTEWQLQKQRQRLMAADLNRLRAEEEREWANWTGWDKPKKGDDDGIAIFSGAAIGENEHAVSGGH